MSSKTKTTDTKEEAKPVRVPKLRFREFRGTGDWTTETLGSVAKISTEKVGDNTCIPMSITSGVGLVSQMEKFGRIIAGNSYANYLLLKKNDFAYNKSATKEYPEGFITLYFGKDLAAVPNSIFTCFRIKGESPVPQYLNYLFLGNLHGKWLRNFIEVGARAHGSLSIDEDDLLALPVPVPAGKSSVREQQKIAECLSSVDELIAAQARKVDSLKTHKKGLMQQLFPREGETQPRLRFPEFQNAGEWEDQSIGDFGKVITGSTPSTAQPAFYGGGIPFVSPADISDMRFVDQTKTTLTAEGFAETRPIRAGSVLFVCIGSTIGKVAQNVHDCATNQQINAVVPSSKHSDGFVYFALSFASERIALLAGRQAVPIINKSLFSSVRILAPKLPEQQRIASCLSSLDALITAETQKHEALKTHKKCLMQQLFPSPEEAVA
jgi:type I restriction enzyme S subunit